MAPIAGIAVAWAAPEAAAVEAPAARDAAEEAPLAADARALAMIDDQYDFVEHDLEGTYTQRRKWKKAELGRWR
jgi:hypothetical protein